MVCTRDYAFRMNVMDEMFEIRSGIEILANDSKSMQLISICSTVNRELQGIHNYWGIFY